MFTSTIYPSVQYHQHRQSRDAPKKHDVKREHEAHVSHEREDRSLFVRQGAVIQYFTRRVELARRAADLDVGHTRVLVALRRDALPNGRLMSAHDKFRVGREPAKQARAGVALPVEEADGHRICDGNEECE